MNFVDFVLVRLAQVETRASVFDQDALQQVVSAGFADDVAALSGPYDALFDEVQVGVSIPRRATVDGHWGIVGRADRTDVQLALSGLGRASTVRVDALWRGAVVARIVSANSIISQVVSAWPDVEGIDAEIVAALGALPSDPAVLESERRKRLLARIQAVVAQPAAFDDAWLGDWLRRIDAQSVSQLMRDFRGQLLTGALQIGFAGPDDAPPAPQSLPLSAALLVRDQPLSIADLLADSKIIREHLLEAGVERARDSTSSRRAPLVIVWIVPSSVFDDPDWPGADPATRRQAAASWLGAEGIAVAVMPKHP